MTSLPPARESVLVIGSGPIVIGQACEFDYSGTQACRVLREEGLRVILVNSNPATIMTDPEFADATYIEPITPEIVEKIIEKERPDAILATLGGQTALNTAMALHASGVLERYGVRLIGASIDAIEAGEDRQRFKEIVASIGAESARSAICHGLDETLAAAEELGFPVVIEAPDRAGERGVGLARDRAELAAAAAVALAESRGDYCLVEELVGGDIVTVNAFSLDGHFVPLTITDREQVPPPAFGVPLAHRWPADLEPMQVGAAVETAAAAVRALGIENGPTTSQVLLGENGPLLAKVSARVGGGHDAELCRVALGVDLNGLAVASALGETVHPQELAARTSVGGACVRFLVAPPGELQDVRGLEEAYAVAGVRGIRVYRKPGYVFRSLRRASDRAGAVLATGDTRDEALDAAGRAAKHIRFVTQRAEAVA